MRESKKKRLTKLVKMLVHETTIVVAVVLVKQMVVVVVVLGGRGRRGRSRQHFVIAAAAAAAVVALAAAVALVPLVPVDRTQVRVKHARALGITRTVEKVTYPPLINTPPSFCPFPNYIGGEYMRGYVSSHSQSLPGTAGVIISLPPPPVLFWCPGSSGGWCVCPSLLLGVGVHLLIFRVWGRGRRRQWRRTPRIEEGGKSCRARVTQWLGGPGQEGRFRRKVRGVNSIVILR